MKNLLYKYYYIVLFLLIALIPFLWFSNDFLLMGPDSLWEFNYSLDVVKEYINIWHSNAGFGHVWQGLSALPFTVFMYVLTGICGFGIGVIQKVVISSLLFASMLFFRKFLYQILGVDANELSILLASIFYAINTFAITWIWWRFLYVMFIYALWPIVFYYFDKIFKNEFNKKNFIVVLFITPFLAPAIGPLIVTFILIIALSIYLIVLLFIQKKYNIFQFMQRLLTTSILILALSMWWFLPGVMSVGDSISHALTAYNPNDALEYTSKDSSIFNTIRLWGYRPIHASFLGERYYGDVIVDADQNIFFQILLTVPLVVIILGIFLINKKQHIYKYSSAFIFLLLVGLFLAKGAQEPFKEFAYSLLNTPIIGPAFRVPYDKFGYLVVFSISVLIGLSISALKKQKRISLYKLSIILMIIFDGVLVIIFASSNLLIKNKQYLSSIVVKIPSEYLALKEMKDLQNSTIVILPFSYEHEFALNWQYGVQPNGNDILSSYIPNSKIIFSPNGNYYNDKIFSFLSKDLFSGDYSIDNINTFFNNIGVNYIFIHKDWNKNFMSNKTEMPEFYLDNYIKNNNKAHLFISNNYFDIYKLDIDNKSLFTFSNNIVYSNDALVANTMNVNTMFVDNMTYSNQQLYTLTRGNDAWNFDKNGKLIFNYSGDIDIKNYGNQTFDLNNFNIEYSSHIPNATFDESNLWSDVDWECYRKYKDLTKKKMEEGNAFLELAPSFFEEFHSEADLPFSISGDTCAMTPINNIKDGMLLFQFSYRTTISNTARVLVMESDGENSRIVLNEKLDSTLGMWKIEHKSFHTYKERTYRLFLYAQGEAAVDYDDFYFATVPLGYKNLIFDYKGHMSNQDIEHLNAIYEKGNSNRYNIFVNNISGAYNFILKYNSSYDDRWLAYIVIDNKKVKLEEHVAVDGYANGWHINANKYCHEESLCSQNPDGSYDIKIALEFLPQRWFYLGLLISGATFFGCIGYLGWDFYRRRKGTRTTSRIADLRGGTYSTKGAQRLNRIGVAHYDRQIHPREDTRRANPPKKRI